MGDTAADHGRAAFQRLQDDLPEEEKNGNMSKIITYIADLIQGGWTVRLAQQNIGELSAVSQHMETIERKLQQLTDCGKEAILEVLEYQKQNTTQAMADYYCDNLNLSLEDLYESVAQDKITEHENTKQLIMDSIKSFHQNESNKMITNMVKGSAYVAAFQLVKIYMAWKTISKASNLIVENPHQLTMINKNLERLEKMVIEFLDLCERNPQDRRVAQKMMRINTLFTSTLSKINNLKVKIDGQIQRLDLLADYSAVDGVVNIAMAGSHGFQLWHTWSDLTSFTKALGVASVAVFTGLAFANYKVFRLSRDTLQDLRRDFNEVKRLQDMLQDLHDQAEQAINEIPE